MKKALLSLSLMAFTVMSAIGQTEAIQVENPNAPEITFETEVIDYGNIEKGADGVREFKFTNTGKSPLIISNARGSCGCTVPTWPKEPIKPGESNVIKVKYDTNRPGPINKSVTITSNAKTATKVLRIKGNIEVPQTSPEKQVPAAAPVAN
ncbi:MAG TPA: hypothetical protein DCX54_03805 [Flavobacteriales bacterium]|nr:hypothetical protein [Flavobacteriales bacterium]